MHPEQRLRARPTLYWTYHLKPISTPSLQCFSSLHFTLALIRMSAAKSIPPPLRPLPPTPVGAPGEQTPGLFTFYDASTSPTGSIFEPRPTEPLTPLPASTRPSLLPTPLKSRTPSPPAPLPNPSAQQTLSAPEAPQPEMPPPRRGFAGPRKLSLPAAAVVPKIEPTEARYPLPFGASYYAPTASDKKVGTDFDAEAALHNNDRANPVSVHAPRKPLPWHFTTPAIGTPAAPLPTHSRPETARIPYRIPSFEDEADTHSIQTASSTTLPASERAPIPVDSDTGKRDSVLAPEKVFLHQSPEVPMPEPPFESTEKTPLLPATSPSLPPRPIISSPRPLQAAGGKAGLPLFYAPSAQDPRSARSKKLLIALLCLFAVFGIIIFIVRMVLDSREAEYYSQFSSS